MAVQRVDFGAMSVREQLAVIQNTTILLGVHGGALTWLWFLPLGAVSVELKPYKFSAHYNFFHLYTNLGLVGDRSHLVWHNTDPRADFQVGDRICLLLGVMSRVRDVWGLLMD